MQSTTPTHLPRRSDQDWLADLRGQHGHAAQQQAYTDLGRFLYVVGYNYLRLRCDDVPVLASFEPEDLSELAQEFVQDALEKLAATQHALLDGYRGIGHFTSWTAVILRREIAAELRKRNWTNRRRGTEHEVAHAAHSGLPLEARTGLEACLTKLAEQERVALLRCVVEEEAAKDVAKSLNKTENAVYLLVFKAKRKMLKCLQDSGIDPTVL